jgi:histidine ammonia-lyase
MVLLYSNGNSVNIDGQTLSIPAVVAVARHGASVELDKSQAVQERMAKSRAVITGKVTDGTSVYGGTIKLNSCLATDLICSSSIDWIWW